MMRNLMMLTKLHYMTDILTKITPNNQHNNRSLNHYTISTTIDHLTTNLFIAMNNAIALIAQFPNAAHVYYFYE